jgi:hypothetical protein
MTPVEPTPDRWLNSGRDRPKGLTLKHWNHLLALVVYGGAVRFTEGDMLADLHAKVPHAAHITALAKLDAVTATHWCWAWELHRPDIAREVERRRAAGEAATG